MPTTWGAILRDLHALSSRERVQACRAFCHRVQRFLRRHGAQGSSAQQAAAVLWTSMSHPDVHYHSPLHVLNILHHAKSLRVRLKPWEELAIYFHDAVYQVRQHSPHNEAASVHLMQALLAGSGIAPRLIADASAAIMATAQHRDAAVPARYHLLLDLDLASLAVPPQQWRLHSALVAAEYAHLPVAAYARGRADFLRAMLGRPRIYRSGVLRRHPHYEAAARANLRADLGG